ncbi:MAG: hypothetical protein QN141_14095 [Armatimonadota bacterium]|nr:hypothetical protein [Armatimonadota bacterium]
MQTLLNRAVAGLALIAAAMAALMSGPAAGQAGPQLIITVQFAAPVRPAGGAYYIAFTVDETLLRGPQPDSTYWTHYVALRGGRFFFGRVPETPYRPFTFEAIRPPAPFLFAEVLPDGRAVRARVPLSSLQTGPTPPTRVKVNVVTVDEQYQPLDALGPGARDPFGFVTVDLRRDLFTALADPTGDAPVPSFDITGGDIRTGTP